MLLAKTYFLVVNYVHVFRNLNNKWHKLSYIISVYGFGVCVIQI